MKIEKKLIKESLGYTEPGKKTFSNKKQNIVINIITNGSRKI